MSEQHFSTAEPGSGTELEERAAAAIGLLLDGCVTDGEDHKQWLIDQTVRLIAGSERDYWKIIEVTVSGGLNGVINSTDPTLIAGSAYGAELGVRLSTAVDLLIIGGVRPDQHQKQWSMVQALKAIAGSEENYEDMINTAFYSDNDYIGPDGIEVERFNEGNTPSPHTLDGLTWDMGLPS